MHRAGVRPRAGLAWDVETTRALGRHARGEARVVPVIIRACDWQAAPFAELQALPQDGEPVTEWASRDKAWLDVTRCLRRALAELAGEQPVAPRYADDESRRLSLRLKELFQRRKDLPYTRDSFDWASSIRRCRRSISSGVSPGSGSAGSRSANAARTSS